MPVPTDITAGTLTLTNGSTAVTGTGTAWLASALRQGDVIIWAEGADGFQMPILADVPSSQTDLTLVNPWPGPTLADVAYRIRFQWDSSRVSGQIRQLTDRLDSGNIVAFAGLEGPGVPVFDGPHSMVIRPLEEFISGVSVNARVQTLAERAAYDGQAANFAVYVNDVGDGRAAVYFKRSPASGDWSTPAYQTGPVGPLPNVEATVTSVASDQTAAVTETPITGGVRLDFSLPRSDGFRNRGPYNPANTYVRDDVVTSNGSTFIALQAVPPGTAPSAVYPPADTSFWQVLVRRGTDGAGTGDVVGPSGAVAGNLVAFSDGTGKAVSDAGISVSEIRTNLPPQGRLTLTNGVSVPVADVVGANAVHYVPAVGTALPIRDTGLGRFVLHSIGAGVSLTLDPDPSHTYYHSANTLFDVFAVIILGEVVIGTSAPWAGTYPVLNRGTGPGTSEVTRVDGIWVNAANIALRSGPASSDLTYHNPGEATLLGSIFIDGSAGQTSDTSRDRLVSNVYNRVTRPAEIQGTGVSHTYSLDVVRIYNNDSANKIRIVQSLPGALVEGDASSGIVTNNTPTVRWVWTGVGLNTVTENNASTLRNPGTASNSAHGISRAVISSTPILGMNEYAWLEQGAGGDTQTWTDYAGVSGLLLRASL